jgi:hypothetical protein
MARTAQIINEKQSITLKTSRSVNTEVQSQKPSAMMKLIVIRTTTGKGDPELPLLQRITSLELPASEIGN